MTKNTKEKEVKSQLQQNLDDLEASGVKHGIILGMGDDEILVIASTFNNYEQIHALLNRAVFETTVNHHNYILNKINPMKFEGENVGE